jgi:hypothetical protein
MPLALWGRGLAMLGSATVFTRDPKPVTEILTVSPGLR